MVDKESLLNNPILHSLSTRLALWGEGDELAKRFHADIGPLAGIAEQSPEAYQSLARLLRADESAALFLESAPQLPPGWRLIRQDKLVQMISRKGESESSPSASLGDGIVIEQLHSADVPEMLALTALTEPGPFRSRTIELGGYLGIRDSGRLAAIAGERLAIPGFIEVSAVCTHPDFRGRGYAKLLVAAVARQIRQRGETPFLTSLESNTGAIRVYESVGFAARRSFELAIVHRPA